MNPSLDTWSTVVAIIAARTSVTLAAAFYARLYRTYPGFSHWVAGMFSGILGFLALILHPFAAFPSVLLANFFNTLLVVLMLDGTARYVHGRRIRRAWYLFPVFGALVGGGLYLAGDLLRARVLWNTVLLSGFALLCARLWLQNPREGALRLSRMSAGLCLAYVVAMSIRGVDWLLAPPTRSLFVLGPTEAAFFLLVGMIDLALGAFYLVHNGQRLDAELRESTARLRLLTGILPICSRCKNIRDEEGRWTPVEQYVRHRTDAEFSHGMCPGCFRTMYPDYAEEVEEMGGFR
jgi:hypothetical protein